MAVAALMSLAVVMPFAVAGAIGGDYLFARNRAMFNVVDFELLGTSEVREYLSVVVGDGDSHGVRSFLDNALLDMHGPVLAMSAHDEQPLAIYQRVSHFFRALL